METCIEGAQAVTQLYGWHLPNIHKTLGSISMIRSKKGGNGKVTPIISTYWGQLVGSQMKNALFTPQDNVQNTMVAFFFIGAHPSQGALRQESEQLHLWCILWIWILKSPLILTRLNIRTTRNERDNTPCNCNNRRIFKKWNWVKHY